MNRNNLPRLAIALIMPLIVSACNENSTADTPKTSISQEQSQDAFAKETLLTTLIPFDSEKQLDWLKPTSTEVNVDKNSKINIKFLADTNISTLRIEPNSPWNMNEFPNYNLAFDVINVQSKSVHFYLSVENEKGEYQSRSVSIPGNYEGTIYFPLTGQQAETEAGFWGDALPWKTDDVLMVWRSWRSGNVNLDTIAALNFFTIGLLEDKQVEISDIRIRQNPELDPTWQVNIVDQFGQNAKIDTPLKVSSVQELQKVANEELQQLAKSKGMDNRSEYGGYTAGPKLKATGYFRTEKVDGKWWMVDPLGYVFFSHGPANVRMANLSTLTGVDYADDSIRVRHADELVPEDSMGSVSIPAKIKETNFVQSELRNKMFEWLPDYSDPLAKHYSYRRSTHKGAIPHGETYSFYQANLERKYGEEAMEPTVNKWHEVTIDRMKDWGFTSFGNWVDPAFYEAKQVPYFANGWIIGDFKTLSGKKNHWGLMPDPYDPLFSERAQATIDEIANKVKASPWCAGIFIDNEKSWGAREGTVEDKYGLILDALSKDANESPAKKAFSAHIKKKYKDIAVLNKTWDTSFTSWTQVSKSITFEEHNDALVADLSKMLEMLGEQYFIVVHNTLEKVLPNHLYMGARMANWGMPDEIIKASIKYSDVLSFNIYEEGVQAHYWDFLEKVDLPVTIGEFHIGSSPDSGLYNPGIVHASGQKDRAEKYKAYMESVLNKPYMVGAHWFQYVDEPITGRAFDGENANIGFVTVTDVPYPELVGAVKDVTSTMYQKRLATEK
ncbi:agarase [Colwellia sp. E2M01]|uniref:agarase n=1 Tax=Colwellia sp. E2M01 TaxID=2841561 RepID=UPI001C09D332|nr:agarase [Colwellia sp. E2M01]MBU2872087.1 agarase [Colwellia sp. E2M01]